VIHELLIRQAGGLFDTLPWLPGTGPWLLVIVAAGSAIVGDQVGYMLGRDGKRLFKPDARILKTRHLDRADDYFQRYGPFSLVLALVPVGITPLRERRANRAVHSPLASPGSSETPAERMKDR
jgi:membrane protein DedA with SNARE-associated domain